jgi:MFS family permease
MHVDPASATPTDPSSGPWYKGLTRYQWFVFFVAFLGWLFDCMDQQLFLLARSPAIKYLLGTTPTDPLINEYGGYVTMIFMMGWAIGGLGFGVLGDRIGRARTMVLTILSYSLFTGLSALSVSVWDFAVYRFLTGLGVGGQFAVGVSLVAEVMPDRSRPFALGWLQALSAVGNIAAALINMFLGFLQREGAIPPDSMWKIMFLIGAVPALLTVVIMRRLKEPERWQAVAGSDAVQKQLGSIPEMFRDPILRRNVIVGMLLAFAGVVGLWGIGFFSFELIRSVLRKPLQEESLKGRAAQDDLEFVRLAIHSTDRFERLSPRVPANALLGQEALILYKAASHLQRSDKPIFPAAVARALDDRKTVDAILKDESPALERRIADAKKEIQPDGSSQDSEAIQEAKVEKVESRIATLEGDLTWWVGIVSVLQNIGAFFGIYTFSRITHHIGRKPAFAVTFVLALLSTAFTFWFLKNFSDVFWMIPLMGFCQLALFGGYAIYFPELFPTRLRSTGTSFCYNVGRFVAAVGPLTLGLLASKVFSGPDRLRYAGVTMCAFFLIGLIVLPFAPETRGKPLPE